MEPITAYLEALVVANEALAEKGVTMDAKLVLNLNGHVLAWVESMRVAGPDHSSTKFALICLHQLVPDFDPMANFFDPCPFHEAACVQRQVELFTELSAVDEIVEADRRFDSTAFAKSLMLLAVLQRMDADEFVGQTANWLTTADVSRLLYGKSDPEFTLDQVLKPLSQRLYEESDGCVGPSAFGRTSKETARIGSAA